MRLPSDGFPDVSGHNHGSIGNSAFGEPVEEIETKRAKVSNTGKASLHSSEECSKRKQIAQLRDRLVNQGVLDEHQRLPGSDSVSEPGEARKYHGFPTSRTLDARGETYLTTVLLPQYIISAHRHALRHATLIRRPASILTVSWKRWRLLGQ